MQGDRPRLVDRFYQRLYALGHRALRPWWRLTHPATQGAFTALWWRGEVLLVKNSYVDYRTFPGGGIEPGEPPEEAAVRECREEVGLEIGAGSLRFALEHDHQHFGRPDHVWVFEVELEAPPNLRIDHREVVEARLVPPSVALAGPLFPAVRRYLESRQGADEGL